MTTTSAAAVSLLRIAIDGSFLDYPPSGIGTYVGCLYDVLERDAASLGISPVLIRPGRITKHLQHGGLGRFVWDAFGFAAAASSRRYPPDVVHIPQMSAPIVTPAPTVVTIHDVIPLVLADYRNSRAMQAYLAVMTRTSARARRIITPSRAAADDIVRILRVAPDRIIVIPEAAAPDLQPDETGHAAARVRERFGIGGPFAFHIGGFDRRKNLPLLIEAFADALRGLPDDFMLVIGGAPHSTNSRLFPSLDPIIRTHGVERRIVFTGRVTNDERRTLYQAAAMTIAPSMYEGFGLTPLESMACGTPVIAANRTSFPELVGDAGILVEPSRDALSAAMQRLATDPHLAARLGAAGRERSRSFSWDAVARQTVAVYRAAHSERSDQHPRWVGSRS